MPRKITRRAKQTKKAMRPSLARRVDSPFNLVKREQINQVASIIVGKFQPEKVILFGSYAYGKPTIDSDVDLLVVMESDERPAKRATRIIGELLDVPFPMDILVRTPREIAHRLNIGDYFFKEIIQQGQVLYER